MVKSSGCGFSGCIGTAFTCDWRLNYNSWAMWPSTIWRFGYLSIMEFTIVMSLSCCRYCLVGYQRIRGQKISARRFATLIDLINRIGPCNRMIDYRK